MSQRTAKSAAVDEDLRAQLLPELDTLRVLGTGTTSTVYLAREVALQRLVAVKVLRKDIVFDAVARMRFEREARSAARIAHPNIPIIYRTGRLRNDQPYIVMEYIDGRAVRDMLAAGKTFAEGEARRCLAAVAAALAAAHDHGIVHRDVQAGNVFVENRTDRVLLTDFGIAALLDTGADSAARLTAVGVPIGDPRYMSPEQLRGEPVTEQSDVYAFGILAYELLTGSGPFPAQSKLEIVRAQGTATPFPLTQVRTDLDPQLAALLGHCLAREPGQRPRARELFAALNNPTTAAAADRSPLEQFMAELGRRRVYRVLAAYAAFAVAVLGVAQVVYEAFELSRVSYQILVGATLGGLPLALIVSWLYDIGAGGIRKAETSAETSRISALKWVALAGIVALVGVAAWLLLR